MSCTTSTAKGGRVAALAPLTLASTSPSASPGASATGSGPRLTKARTHSSSERRPSTSMSPRTSQRDTAPWRSAGCARRSASIARVWWSSEASSRFLRLHRAAKVLLAERQPRSRLAEPAVFAIFPRHRGARAVAAQRQRPVGDGFGIVKLFERDIDLGQPQFLALIEDHIAAQAQPAAPSSSARRPRARAARTSG